MKRKSVFICVAVVLLIGLFQHGAQAKDDMITIVSAQEPMIMDPTQSTSGNDSIITQNWTEEMVLLDTNGTVTPGVVSSWKLSPDGLKLECTLRQGVKFHSGDSLTTKDVKFSFERNRKLNRSVKSNTASVKSLEIIDDYHFTFHFKSADITFIPRRFANIVVVSKSYYDRVGEETFAKKPMGTGPYKLVSYKAGEYIDLERFDEYWGKKPPIKKARFYFVGEEITRVAKLKTGEVDLIQSVPFPEVKILQADTNFKVTMLETNHPTRSILMGSKNPNVPWYDKRVRMAMALAIDQFSIVKNLFFGIPVHRATLSPGELGYDPSLKPYPYDPEKAKKLLAEAGYPKGFEMPLTFQTGGRVAMMRELAEALASYFEAVGIRTKLIGQETEAILADRKKALKKDAVYVSLYSGTYTGGVDPVDTLKTFLTSYGSRPVYSNPEVDELIKRGLSTVDDQKRAEIIKKAVKIVYDDVGMIPVVTNVSCYAMKKNVDFTPTKGVNFDYLFVKNMKFND